jgi:hypothetical protein
MKRRVGSRPTDLTTWVRWSSTCRSGIANRSASSRDERRDPVNRCMRRCRTVPSGGIMECHSSIRIRTDKEETFHDELVAVFR